MNLQAKHPETNAAKKPTTIGTIPSELTTSPLTKSNNSKNASPKIGINTIKKENLVTLSFFTPHNNPVAIVVPLRLRPGNTATACARPMIIASL